MLLYEAHHTAEGVNDVACTCTDFRRCNPQSLHLNILWSSVCCDAVEELRPIRAPDIAKRCSKYIVALSILSSHVRLPTFVKLGVCKCGRGVADSRDH